MRSSPGECFLPAWARVAGTADTGILAGHPQVSEDGPNGANGEASDAKEGHSQRENGGELKAPKCQSRIKTSGWALLPGFAGLEMVTM